MSQISILIALVIAGAVLWLINTYVPMDGKIKNIFNAVVVVIAILWLLSALGMFGSESTMHMNRLHFWR